MIYKRSEAFFESQSFEDHTCIIPFKNVSYTHLKKDVLLVFMIGDEQPFDIHNVEIERFLTEYREYLNKYPR